MAIADTGGRPANRITTAGIVVAMVLLALVLSVVVLVTLDEPGATANPASVPSADRQEITERLVNEGYLPREVLD